MPEPRTAQAVELMTRFAERTGVTTGRPPRRYLWTDAFAVCNFLELARVTGDGGYRELALRLVEQVHRVLGRHRPDDRRSGWISGLGSREGEAHPTAGGLRIGKRLAERTPEERIDERLEWDRDGQYFHYLTKWMHALDQVARVTGQRMFNLWARELADVAYRAFTYRSPDGSKRMYWKMSIDLSRPLVASMGQHDPLDGFITCIQLRATPGAGPDLARAASDFAGMVDATRLATGDPLGLGGLLVDASRVEQLIRRDAWPADDRLLGALLDAAEIGLRHYLKQSDLQASAAHRLAFRELGLAIGLAALARTQREAARTPGTRDAPRAVLEAYESVREDIESFWLRPAHRRGASWRDHEDINDVMLATSLLPEGFVALEPSG
jgi:hypothetical protein